MNIDQVHLVRCHTCGTHDVIEVSKCKCADSAHEEFVSNGWAEETINGETGPTCPDCRTVNGYLKITTEAY